MIKITNQFVTFIPPDGAAYLIGDFTDWDENPLLIKEPVTLEFPQGAYIEYAFLDIDHQPVTDSTNPCKPINPWYSYHRAIILPGNKFEEPPQATLSHGCIHEHVSISHQLADQKKCYVYEPFVSPKSTVYVHDGEAFYQKLRLHVVADELIRKGEIEPLRLVFIVPHQREVEYWFNETYEAFILKELMPEIEFHYGATATQALWGASLGGLVSFWIAWKHPEIFTKVGSLSGCFTAHPQGHDEYHDPEWLLEQFTETPGRPLRFYLQTGQIEWLLAPNRRFAAMLQDKGYTHCYQEYPGGHNWATWTQGLEPGLKYLFGH